MQPDPPAPAPAHPDGHQRPSGNQHENRMKSAPKITASLEFLRRLHARSGAPVVEPPSPEPEPAAPESTLEGSDAAD